MKKIVLVFVVCVIIVSAQENFENAGVRVALKIYDDCSKVDGFSSCLKKKQSPFLDRLGRMEKFYLTEGIAVIRAPDVQIDESIVTEEQLDNTLSRSSVAKDDALNSMLFDTVAKFVGSRTLEITMPKFSVEDFRVEKGRKGGEGGGGGGGGGKGGMKGMMGGMMMGIAAKMAAMIPVAIAGLFLLAGKALITAKIALLLSGIIAIKKLFGSKQSGGGGSGGGHGHGWQSSGHGGGGWQSGGGGWDKRSIDEPQQLAYKAYSPK
ncbi:hypothetical protein NQ314_016693 [Rhamnusium bicolor]|uniref:Uncharacterized protein n=1 Tax=Rhamnusium bicolor TaxID=1586634 RepID=A0AAV8WWD7_9CUCU|nr:hypothetical protein NQ314_016693 [Rhamnusium bicolor]